jgi:hypothetical protein
MTVAARHLRARVFGIVAAGALAVSGCGNATNEAPPSSIVPADALLYAEFDLTLSDPQEAGLSKLVEAATGKKPEGNPLLSALEAVGGGHAGALADVRGDLGWIGDRIAYVQLSSFAPGQNGVIVAVRDADGGLDALEEALGEEPRQIKLGGADVKEFREEGVVAGEIGGYLVVGGRPFVEAIARDDHKKPLGDRPTFKRVAAARPGAFATIYVDLPRAAAQSARFKARAEENLGARALKEPYGYVVDVEEDSIGFEQLTGGTQLPGLGATKLVEEAPSGAFFSLGARDLASNGRRLLSATASLAEVPDIGPDVLERDLRRSGFDLDRDVLGWMGDGAIWASGRSGRSFVAGMIVEAAEPAVARATFKKLHGKLLADRYLVRGTATDWRLDFGRTGELHLTLKGDRATLTFRERARPGRGHIVETAAGQRMRKMLDGARPAFLLDVDALIAFVNRTSMRSDSDWLYVKRLMKVFSSVAGFPSDRGAPRIEGLIRDR